MNVRPLLLVNTMLVAAMAAVSAWTWSQIPDNAQIPVHWNLEGQVDRFGSKFEALVLFPALLTVVTLIMAIIPRFDPRRENLEASGKFWNAATILIGLLLAYTHGLLTWTALGHSVDMTNALVPALCILFAGIGNYLGKTKSNWFGGVRTPWTMSSEYSWEKTHRLAGYMFMLTSAATFTAWLAVGAMPAFIVLFAAMMLTVLTAFVMSYVYWRNDPDRSTAQSK
jgi:uncharacterized membrane protein